MGKPVVGVRTVKNAARKGQHCSFSSGGLQKKGEREGEGNASVQQKFGFCIHVGTPPVLQQAMFPSKCRLCVQNQMGHCVWVVPGGDSIKDRSAARSPSRWEQNDGQMSLAGKNCSGKCRVEDLRGPPPKFKAPLFWGLPWVVGRQSASMVRSI